LGRTGREKVINRALGEGGRKFTSQEKTRLFFYLLSKKKSLTSSGRKRKKQSTTQKKTRQENLKGINPGGELRWAPMD